MKNKRCPFQEECERQCKYEGHELDCKYYAANSYGDFFIPDQERIRQQRENEREKFLYEAELEEIDPEAEDENNDVKQEQIWRIM